MKIETDKKKILKDRRYNDGLLSGELDLERLLEPLLEEAYIRGYSDAMIQIGIQLTEEDE